MLRRGCWQLNKCTLAPLDCNLERLTNMSVCIVHARESTMLVLLHLKTLLDHCIGYHYIVIVEIDRER